MKQKLNLLRAGLCLLILAPVLAAQSGESKMPLLLTSPFSNRQYSLRTRFLPGITILTRNLHLMAELSTF